MKSRTKYQRTPKELWNVSHAKASGAPAPDWIQEKNGNRQSHVINRAYVRKWALDYAATNRSHPFNRVSEEFLNAVEADTKAFIRNRINRAPSKGITLK